MKCWQGKKFVLAITLLIALVVPTAKRQSTNGSQDTKRVVPGWNLQAAITGTISEPTLTTFANLSTLIPQQLCVNCLAFVYQLPIMTRRKRLPTSRLPISDRCGRWPGDRQPRTR